MKLLDVMVIGAGAAGLMCAIEAGKRGKSVLVLDSANKVGKKILMSGGGRCNFTNYQIEPCHYQSHNPHFCKSALTRYTQWDFIELVKKHQIDFYEKTLGQLFCVNKSQEIVNMLLAECDDAGVNIQLNTKVNQIEKKYDMRFEVKTQQGSLSCKSLVIATGGLSIPTLGSSPFAYHVAEQFGILVHPTRAGLVPFTLNPEDKQKFAALSGVSLPCLVSNARAAFKEALLFTHRGLSGPAILQISSYWMPGEAVLINLLPEHDLLEMLQAARTSQPKKQLSSVLSVHLPKRVVDVFISKQLLDKKLADLSNKALALIPNLLQNWTVKPEGTEGYRTAEVTLGGVDCNAISSKTMEVKATPGLYFIGEALDVTGLLGGYNFQWAWSSGFAAGQAISVQ